MTKKMDDSIPKNSISTKLSGITNKLLSFKFKLSEKMLEKC